MTETVAGLACAEFGDDEPFHIADDKVGARINRVLALAAGDYGHLRTGRPSGEETVHATLPGWAVTTMRTGGTGTGR
jgi:hypothetical protein